MGDPPPTSRFCDATTTVIQIHSGVYCGQIAVADRRARRMASWMILPGANGTLACPLNYFQEHASLPEGWIADDKGKRIDLGDARQIVSMTVTVTENSRESECALAENLKTNLLSYFMMDIVHNERRYNGFDCHAFVSLLTNTEFRAAAPPFHYEQRNATAGDIVALSDGPALPNSIKHWALCVGDNHFISKFGRAGNGAQALLETTDQEAMLSLYECNRVLIATRRGDARPWDGTRYR